MKPIAIFGGAFDPPHVGHLSNISAVLNSGLASEVWLVPSSDVRDKPSNAPAAHRVKMLERFIEENFNNDPALRLELCQIKENAPGSFTVDLMAHLRAAHPGKEFSFVIGTELVKDLPKWKDAQRLKTEVQFLVVPRPGHALSDTLGFNLALIPDNALLSSGASSTAIRQLIKDKKRTAGFLSPAVLSYIKANQLYV